MLHVPMPNGFRSPVLLLKRRKAIDLPDSMLAMHGDADLNLTVTRMEPKLRHGSIAGNRCAGGIDLTDSTGPGLERVAPLLESRRGKFCARIGGHVLPCLAVPRRHDLPNESFGRGFRRRHEDVGIARRKHDHADHRQHGGRYGGDGCDSRRHSVDV
jgi:hypothetical protein